MHGPCISKVADHKRGAFNNNKTTLHITQSTCLTCLVRRGPAQPLAASAHGDAAMAVPLACLLDLLRETTVTQSLEGTCAAADPTACVAGLTRSCNFYRGGED